MLQANRASGPERFKEAAREFTGIPWRLVHPCWPEFSRAVIFREHWTLRPIIAAIDFKDEGAGVPRND